MQQTRFEEQYGIDRRNTHCIKWDSLTERFGDTDLVAMWVADMDFKAPDAVIEALSQRSEHGVFGYSKIASGYYDSFINWENKRHGYNIQKEWIRYTPGVVAGIYWIINAFTQPGDSIIINTPVYYPFHDAIKECSRTLITSDLTNHNGYYRINYDDFEAKIIEHHVKLYILCSPHNPVGRVWQQDELAELLAICHRHNVLVISDEIHQDLILSGKHYPSAIVAESKYNHNLITLTAASKTFNLAGCKNSFAIIENPQLREKFDRYANVMTRMASGSLFGYIASEAAYTYGEAWLTELIHVIKGNYQYLKQQLESALPLITISPLEGTYLVWIDLRAYTDNAQLPELMQKRCKLAVDYGEWFGDSGKGFIRINIATFRSNIAYATQQLIAELTK